MRVSAAGQPPAHWKTELAKNPIGNTSDRFNLRRHKEEKGQMKEDWNDRSKWRKKIM
jgi:hypothetical protein